jgi:hypothetical protein
MRNQLLIFSMLLALVSCRNENSGPITKVTYTDLYGNSVQITDCDSLASHLKAIGEIAHHLFTQVNQHYISFREVVQLTSHYNYQFNKPIAYLGIGGCIHKDSINALPD